MSTKSGFSSIPVHILKYSLTNTNGILANLILNPLLLLTIWFNVFIKLVFIYELLRIALVAYI